MSKDITAIMQTNFHQVHGMLNQFIEICPDTIWQLKFGGWPVWQHIAHTFSGYDFFILNKGETPHKLKVSTALCAMREVGTQDPGKDVIQAMGVTMKDAADRYIETLNDRTLTQTHDGCTERFGMPMTHASVLSLLASHGMYHLGLCDGAMREHGLKGVL